MAPGSTLLVAEAVAPPGNDGFVIKVTDVEMLVLTPGGQERTAEEFRQLFARAGLKLRRIVPTVARFSIIAGQPA